MDNETKEFLAKLFETLERRIIASEARMREDLIATEERIVTRTDELVTVAKIELLNSMNQWKRTRDLRLLALESRLGEIEKRVDRMQTGGGS
jgi:hypothetical protein